MIPRLSLRLTWSRLADSSDVAPKLISPDPVERNSSLNAYVADLAHLSSPWATAEGITEIKQLSEAWGSARLRGEVESVEYDKE